MSTDGPELTPGEAWGDAERVPTPDTPEEDPYLEDEMVDAITGADEGADAEDAAQVKLEQGGAVTGEYPVDDPDRESQERFDAG